MNFNQITLVGNVSSDIEMRYTPSGTAVTSFNLAVNEGSKDKQTTLFVRITCWEKLAETAKEYLVKGQGVLVSGKMSAPRAYARKDGELAASAEVTAFTVQFGAKPKGYQDDGGGNPSALVNPTPDVKADIPF